MRTLRPIASPLTLALTLSFALSSACLAEEDDPLALFQQRIMPIFRSPNPSSCVQCHLSSVDLKDYILPSHEKTFLSLRDQGLIDLQRPEESKILKLISMGERDEDRTARLIHSRTRQAEHEAFRAWIAACCGDPRLRELPPLPPEEAAAGPERPRAVIRHARKDRVLDSFVRNVWSQRMRCFPCHTPAELDAGNPQHAKPIRRHRELVQQYGARMNLFRDTPEATMKALIASSRKVREGRLPLLNLDEPRSSLLILKPTSKLPAKDGDGKFQAPSYSPPVTHMGGLKMHVDDPSYKAFVAWIGDYARVVRGQYDSGDDLPADNWTPTRHVLRVRGVPPSWREMDRVQLLVHAWDAAAQRWSARPVAFTQSVVTPKRFVNGALFLLQGSRGDPDGGAAAEAGEAGRLPPGRYLIKAYRDTQHRLADDPAAMLDESDFAGQQEIRARWGQGFRQAVVVDARFAK